jgi:hypothetical protein
MSAVLFILKWIVGAGLILFGIYLLISGNDTIIPSFKIGGYEVTSAPMGLVIILIGAAILILWKIKYNGNQYFK